MEQKAFIEEKNIFKKIFLYSKERNKLIDLENNDDMSFKVFNEEKFYKIKKKTMKKVQMKGITSKKK